VLVDQHIDEIGHGLRIDRFKISAVIAFFLGTGDDWIKYSDRNSV
jgi:hypothetical protein